MPDNEVQDQQPEAADNKASVCPIIGIGASAGGIEALQRFLPSVPADSGLAFIIVLHLARESESFLAEILSRAGPIPAVQVSDGMVVEANRAHVIPPDKVLTIDEGRLHLADLPGPEERHNTIDGFLISLADDQGDNAACVILSGTGSDGTVGLRAIKENGGLTVAQAHAQYEGMMQSAVATGLVDFVLPVEEIPQALVNHFRHREEVVAKKGPDGGLKDTSDYLRQICSILLARTGHDFSGYKDTTVTRRVRRRMQVLLIDEVPEFIDRLRNDPREADLLFQDLLIGVTSFFRDPQSFEALEKDVIPRLFEGKGPDDTVRVWIPGCSSGEEAYSVAILLREHLLKSHSATRLQIFASDINEHALEIARIGRYPASAAGDVSSSRLQQFFFREDGTYRIASDLRGICLFARHDLLRDAPFSRLDLISCRNLMIYLSPELQGQVIPLLHYALRDGGYLFLGSSENVTRHSRLFRVVDRAHHIFRRQPQIERRVPEFPLVAPNIRPAPVQARSAATEVTLPALAERQLLDRYAPAYVIINPEGEVLYASGRTGKYLELPSGAPITNIFGMARQGLRLDLRAAVHRAAGRGEPVMQRNVTIGTNGGRLPIDLFVHPLRHNDTVGELLMVVFQDRGPIEPVTDGQPAPGPEDARSASIYQLENELRSTRERLQTTTEELESANEELKSRNEELSSMNEELQSTNEELETSKEELQSINEELQTVNAELKARVDELSRANSDIANLLESTQIATVFLDRNLHIASFTPAAKELFHLVESDTGRPLAHVRARFLQDRTVDEDAERVLRTLTTIERQVESSETSARYMMRIMPYRTIDHVIGGVVITFTDVTEMTAAEARIGELAHDLRNRVESLQTLLDLLPVGIFITENREPQQAQVNRCGGHMLGLGDGGQALRQAPLPLPLFRNGDQVPSEEQPLQRTLRAGQAVSDFEGRLVRADGSVLYVLMSATPLFDEAGRPRGAIAAMVDITQRKQAEEAQERLLHELQHRVKNILATVGSLVSRMLKGAPSVEQFSSRLLDRLMAMGNLHDQLSRRNWQGADLRELLEATLAAYVNHDKSNVTLSGPERLLAPDTAGTLGLVFHELATNAAKYGPLSVQGGRVDVRWRVEPRGGTDWLVLDWAESDGPRVADTRTEGFGLGFVKRSVEYELGGTVHLVFEPSGLRCTIEFPLSEGVAQIARAADGK